MRRWRAIAVPEGASFVGVMALENLAGVIVAEGGGSGSGDVEEEIHADGEVGGVEESGSALFDQVADVVQMVVPAGGADDHVLACFYAGSDVVDDAVGGGEIDNRVDVAELSGVRAALDAFSLRPRLRGDACGRRLLPPPGAGFAAA